VLTNASVPMRLVSGDAANPTRPSFFTATYRFEEALP
jgi:hypothetical protein